MFASACWWRSLLVVFSCSVSMDRWMLCTRLCRWQVWIVIIIINVQNFFFSLHTRNGQSLVDVSGCCYFTANVMTIAGRWRRDGNGWGLWGVGGEGRKAKLLWPHFWLFILAEAAAAAIDFAIGKAQSHRNWYCRGKPGRQALSSLWRTREHQCSSNLPSNRLLLWWQSEGGGGF